MDMIQKEEERKLVNAPNKCIEPDPKQHTSSTAPLRYTVAAACCLGRVNAAVMRSILRRKIKISVSK
jgi:hypothetical protein